METEMLIYRLNEDSKLSLVIEINERLFVCLPRSYIYIAEVNYEYIKKNSVKNKICVFNQEYDLILEVPDPENIYKNDKINAELLDSAIKAIYFKEFPEDVI